MSNKVKHAAGVFLRIPIGASACQVKDSEFEVAAVTRADRRPQTRGIDSPEMAQHSSSWSFVSELRLWRLGPEMHKSFECAVAEAEQVEIVV